MGLNVKYHKILIDIFSDSIVQLTYSSDFQTFFTISWHTNK